MRLAPDRRVRQAEGWLAVYAQEVPEGRELLRERIVRTESGTSSGTDNDRVRTSLGSSTTEARAIAALTHREHWEQYDRDIEAIQAAIRQARRHHHLTVMRGTDLPEPEQLPPCKEGQHGKAGAIEWGDPTCDFPPDKAGMCQSHYMAWYRHRKQHGIDTTKDFAA